MKTLVNVIKVFLLAFALLVVGVVLIGCDVFSGGNTFPDVLPCPPRQAPDPTGPPSSSGSYACPKIMKRGHCTDCKFDRGDNSSKGRGWYCSVCSGGYHANNISLCHQLELSCVKYCPEKVQKTPDKPSDVQGNNGVEWPTMCLDTHVSHFFGIGDWGGLYGWDGEVGVKDEKAKLCTQWYGEENVVPGMPCPMPNQRGTLPNPATNGKVEASVQKKVSERMSARAKILRDAGTPPQFVINVGDNFYPGGVNVHCNKGDPGDMNVQNSSLRGGQLPWQNIVQKQFEQVWKGVYPGYLTEELEWWSVLGNHDYGGECYIKGWDQQIWYTYNQGAKPKWLMPGQYWKRSVQYKNFKVDFFFLDTNWYDASQPDRHVIYNHDICNIDLNKNIGPGPQVCSREHYPGNPGANIDSCGDGAPSAAAECPKWFEDLWDGEYKWLMNWVPKSTADWQILVSHYPSKYIVGMDHPTHTNRVVWEKWMPTMGIDLAITGHDHIQQIYYGDFGETEKGQGGKWYPSPFVITGGGGGVTSAQTGRDDGQDDGYGFMEFDITLTELTIKTWSHGGTEGRQILRNWTVVQPVPYKGPDEIIRLGLDPNNLLQRRETVI